MVREITITWPRRRAYSNVLQFKITGTLDWPVRYHGLYANAHRGKVRKAGRTGFPVYPGFLRLQDSRAPLRVFPRLSP